MVHGGVLKSVPIHVHHPSRSMELQNTVLLEKYNLCCVLSRPLPPQFCMKLLSICTSWHVNMCNVTEYRAHSPSAAVRRSAASISFQEKQAEGQRATVIYIPQSHSNSLMQTMTNPKHRISTSDMTFSNAMKGIKLCGTRGAKLISIRIKVSNKANASVSRPVDS